MNKIQSLTKVLKKKTENKKFNTSFISFWTIQNVKWN